jgi:hypothetical protein
MIFSERSRLIDKIFLIPVTELVSPGDGSLEDKNLFLDRIRCKPVSESIDQYLVVLESLPDVSCCVAAVSAIRFDLPFCG